MLLAFSSHSSLQSSGLAPAYSSHFFLSILLALAFSSLSSLLSCWALSLALCSYFLLLALAPSHCSLFPFFSPSCSSLLFFPLPRLFFPLAALCVLCLTVGPSFSSLLLLASYFFPRFLSPLLTDPRTILLPSHPFLLHSSPLAAFLLFLLFLRLSGSPAPPRCHPGLLPGWLVPFLSDATSWPTLVAMASFFSSSLLPLLLLLLPRLSNLIRRCVHLFWAWPPSFLFLLLLLHSLLLLLPPFPSSWFSSGLTPFPFHATGPPGSGPLTLWDLHATHHGPLGHQRFFPSTLLGTPKPPQDTRKHFTRALLCPTTHTRPLGHQGRAVTLTFPAASQQALPTP